MPCTLRCQRELWFLEHSTTGGFAQLTAPGHCFNIPSALYVSHCHESGCLSPHYSYTSPMDYNSHHSLHYDTHISTIALITQLSPITHQPWLFCHTCTSFTHPDISSTLPYTRCEVLFCTGWHSERFPCFHLDCLFTLTVCCLPFDILSVWHLPRPLHCPCCWFCLVFITPVTTFDHCLSDHLLSINKAAIGSNYTASSLHSPSQPSSSSSSRPGLSNWWPTGRTQPLR